MRRKQHFERARWKKIPQRRKDEKNFVNFTKVFLYMTNFLLYNKVGMTYTKHNEKENTMLKRLFCLMMALMLCPVLALAEESSAAALTLEELLTWTEGYRARAMSAQPLNNPADEETEDGYAFVYDFATLYMDRPEMTGDAVMLGMVVTDPDEMAPHGTSVDMLAEDVLAAYYNENETLLGDKGFAPLYVSDYLPMGAAWGWVQRDGQRLMTIQYAVQDQLAAGGEGYTDTGLVYTLKEGMVSAIRVYGLAHVVQEEDVRINMNTVQELFDNGTYSQVAASYMGTDLEPFGEKDLFFAGIDLMTVTPEKAVEALGDCLQENWMLDDNGEFICTMEFAKCEMTFVCDENKENPRAEMLVIAMDGMEGPRAVRVGDSLTSVLNRFRHSEGEYGDMREVLYGDPAGDVFGTVEYGEDASATVRYKTATSQGQSVMLYLYFENMTLKEMLIFTMD